MWPAGCLCLPAIWNLEQEILKNIPKYKDSSLTYADAGQIVLVSAVAVARVEDVSVAVARRLCNCVRAGERLLQYSDVLGRGKGYADIDCGLTDDLSTVFGLFFHVRIGGVC